MQECIKVLKPMKKITVIDLPIRLGQFLKLGNLVQDGFEAKIKIQEGQVMVNGLLETRRGKKLYPGDTVTIDGETWTVDAHE
jgi:ribosome-associated protein